MYKKLKLKNGTNVILVPKSESRSLTLLVLYKVGSRYENLKINHGVSHFIEHLMFKGTKKRPTTFDISKELDGIGAEFNAYTSKDHTGYYIKADAAKFSLACDILADMLNNSLFAAQEIEREKGVIIEEIKMYEEQPIYFSEMLFERLVFQGNTLAEDIAGTETSIKKMQRKDILNYLRDFYRPENALIILAGKINKNAITTLNKYFVQKTVNNKSARQQKFVTFENKQKDSRILLDYRKIKQVYVALGFPAYSYFHPDLYALYVLGIILGGNMSSRLFIEVREKKGLCYSIKSQVDVYEDSGDLMVRAGLDLNKINEAMKIIIRELKKIKEKGITQKELAMAKEFLKGHLTLQLEETQQLAEFYGRQFLLTNEILTPEEKFRKISAVTQKQVNKVAQDIIKNGKMNLAVIGPFKNKKGFFKLIRI